MLVVNWLCLGSTSLVEFCPYLISSNVSPAFSVSSIRSPGQPLPVFMYVLMLSSVFVFDRFRFIRGLFTNPPSPGLVLPSHI